MRVGEVVEGREEGEWRVRRRETRGNKKEMNGTGSLVDEEERKRREKIRRKTREVKMRMGSWNWVFEQLKEIERREKKELNKREN